MRSTTDEDAEERNFSLQNQLVGVKTKGRQFQGTGLQKSTKAKLKFSEQISEDTMGTRIFNKVKCVNSEHRQKNVLAAVEKNRALDVARSFKYDNPFFTLVMQRSYIGSGCYLSMPKDFAAKHLKEECVVQLQTLDGRTWPAKFKVPKIGEGWRKFVKENGLKVGDVCVFEIIDLSFKVHIFRDAEKGDLKVNAFEKEQSSCMQDPPLEKESSSISENPRFVALMTHTHIYGTSYLHVPIDFAKAHLHNRTKSVTFHVQDKDWTVGYAFRSFDKQQIAAFTWGWKQFCKDNDLKVGDVCDFELTQKSKFQVTTFRATT
ncbi:B3 domain-containing protein Os03g0620400-like isoform X2 [Prosopis cineraria]|uniref:B3 domain-containing protein Os03g0620400-like isoform X2 n=1 Tax=Prosopis cineraria TaxID=364024 RepID=UPI0024100638|nr:B3 domain-containing protein Os03g0620400-like isoform X2 [Prosopis cineraria]